ncbi:TDT family transporter [Streptomyces sp. LE64]|uniref:TDT family transporter n=1 Tax=Streptomyces sp. LE64 TaxID=3448653 RepID=UPI0040437F96
MAPAATAPPPAPPVPSPARRRAGPAPGGGARRSVRHLGPNWYATVMGTAILATAGAEVAPGAPLLWLVLWSLSLVVLVVLVAARARHWRRHPDQARAHLDDPAVAPFYGCLAMALLAVGGGAATLGPDLLGTPGGVRLGLVLWVLGTLVGLVVAVGLPYRLVTAARRSGRRPTPVWLLTVVAPVVSAATGPLFVPHLPTPARQPLLFGCLVLLGAGVLGTLVLLPSVCAALVASGGPPLALTPTLFLVLGPLGQSTTALDRIAGASGSPGWGAFTVVYGVPVLGFAMCWLVAATALVVRARRRGMRFTMAWWSFTFPVGTCVTGAAALADRTGSAGYRVLAVLLYAGLAAAWAVAAVRTAREVALGRLPAAPR